MGAETEIAWTDKTFNPWWGCVRVSPGCEHCYAETWDKRYGGKNWGAQAPRRFFGDKHWNEPRKWNKAALTGGGRARVFCASMADVFEDRRDLDDQRARLFALIAETPALDWQLLTKRPENMVRLAPATWTAGWPANVWAGTTVEDQKRADERIPHLLRVPAAIRFLSAEPLLSGLDLRSALRLARHHQATFHAATGTLVPVTDKWIRSYNINTGQEAAPEIDWLIVGGESGGGARPMHLEWARSLVEQCKAAGTAVFCKQLGAVPVMDEAAWRERSNSGAGTLLLSAANQKRAPAGTVPLKLASSKGGDPLEWPGGPAAWPREFPRSATCGASITDRGIPHREFTCHRAPHADHIHRDGEAEWTGPAPEAAR